jgi:predicted RNA binding protein YcfA (HicA-like mRNA interferase family)
MKKQKIIEKLLSGESDNNFDFSDLVILLKKLGFQHRVKGSHNIFYRKFIFEIINIQPLKENKAKPYQVKQIRNLILKYKLKPKSDEK